MKYLESLEELLEAPEGERYQFKEAQNRYDFEDAVKCCCALANGGGGKLILGITDKRPRQIVGSKAFDQPERTREGIINRLHIQVSFEIYNGSGLKKAGMFAKLRSCFSQPMKRIKTSL